MMSSYMSASSGPIRPPRSFKVGKDSNGLLISVIRTLSASQNNAERDREKAKLEKDFKRSDQRLDDLITGHQEDLMKAMQYFSKVASRISVCKERIHSIKERLSTCKNLLHCKRDELKKLWLEAVEHKYVLQLLEEIESLVEVPEKLENFMNTKQYLHATQLLVNSVSLLEGSLEGVDALKEVKTKLVHKKERMHQVLVEELHRQLYVRTTNDVLQKFKRQGSDRRRHGASSPTPMKMTAYESSVVPVSGRSENKSPTSLTEDVDLLQLEETCAATLEGNSTQYIAILVECLALLNKIPETVETIQERCQQELLSVVRRTTQFLLDSGQTTNQITTSQPRLLLDLLDLLFEQFQCVAKAHECVLSNLQRVSNSQNCAGIEVTTYDMARIWSSVQAVLEFVVGKYLDIHNTASVQQPAPLAFTEATTTNDVASYFARRRNVKQKKFALFRFDCSSHAMSMNAYLQEKKEEGKDENDLGDVEDGTQQLVCQPTPKNITWMFKPLMKFVGDIESTLALEEGTHCQLYSSLIDYVKVFLAHVNIGLESVVDNATKGLDNWKVTSDPEVLKSLGVTRPLLQSTICLDQGLQSLVEWMKSLPLYADHFLNLACNILQSYKETTQVAYRGIVQPESEDKRIISATWAKDEDISRFLMSLPNWANLQLLKENKGSVDLEESPEEVRLRNKKESEILIGNLTGDTLIPQHEILSDVAQLGILGQLQESLEWLSSRILGVAHSLPLQQQQSMLSLPCSPSRNATQELQPVQESTVQTLQHLAKDFQELSDTCLLVLHLEVRVHCFYYLVPVTVQGNFSSNIDSQEPDPEVMKLNKDLSSIDEAMSSCLQQRKHRYIFEGLGHLVASILINSTPAIQKINENGIKKMCRNIFAIQQNLTSITMNREVALDHARQYFELFYHSAEDILDLIVEHGPQFQEMEYKNVFQLLHRSQPTQDRDQDSLTQLLSRLQDILNEVAVAV